LSLFPLLVQYVLDGLAKTYFLFKGAYYLTLYLNPVRGIIHVSWLSCHGLYALSAPYGSCQSGMETTNMM
jgi:hypothetical protein